MAALLAFYLEFLVTENVPAVHNNSFHLIYLVLYTWRRPRSEEDQKEMSSCDLVSSGASIAEYVAMPNIETQQK